MARLAAEIIRDKQASEIEKSLAGSVLSEANPAHHPSEGEIEKAKKGIARKALAPRNA